MRDQIVLPRNVVDVDLHDAEVRHGRAEVRAHRAAEVPVEIVRRDVHLVRVGHRCDLVRLPGAVPGHVDDGDVHRLVREIGAKFPNPVQRFARSDGHVRVIADVRQAFWIEQVEFVPEEIEIFKAADHLQIPLDFEVEVHVEQDVYLVAHAFTERRH